MNGTIQLDDQALVEAILADPPRRELLPALGRRRPDTTMLRRQQALFRALSITEHQAVRELLYSGLTEPLDREQTDFAPVPLAATHEAARVARWLMAEGWVFEEIRFRLEGLRQLWSALGETAPDGWVVRDVARVLCNLHRDRRPVAEVYRGIEAAEALWRSDQTGSGEKKLKYFQSFLHSLSSVF